MKQKNQSFQKMIKAIKEFRDKRDWGQYHTLKDLAMDLVIEASEAMECVLWVKEEQRKKS